MWKPSILIIFSLTILSMNSCVFYRTALEEEYRKQADIAYNAGKYDEALEYYNKSKFISYNNNSRYRVAEIQLRLKEYEKSRKQINRLLFRDPRNMLVKELDAYWFFATGDIVSAKEKYKKILKNEPYNTRVLNNLGIIYFQEQDYEQSVSYYTESLLVEALPIKLLADYISSITILSSNNTSEDSISETYLVEIVNSYLNAFQEQQVTIDDLYEITNILQTTHVQYTYPIYKLIAEQEVISEDKEMQAKVAKGNFLLAKLIFSKEYVPDDIDAIPTAFLYLNNALSQGYGNNREQWNEIKALIEYLTTDLQKKRMAEIYHKYNIITDIEYEQILDGLDPAKNSDVQIEKAPTQ